jgi:hypothetical protein
MAHVTDRCLVGKEVPAIHGIIKMFVRRIAFAGWMHTAVDTALGANGMGPTHRNEGKKVHLTACLGNFYGRHEARKPSPYDNNPVVHENSSDENQKPSSRWPVTARVIPRHVELPARDTSENMPDAR